VNLRRTTTKARQPATPSPDREAQQPVAKPGGKGRPTPKRSEAQGKRRAVTAAPTDRKSAVRQQRDTIKSTRRLQRAAVLAGDEKNYPPMHAGKERGVVRDVIDSRRPIIWVAMPLAIIVIMLMMVTPPTNEPAVIVLNVLLLGFVVVIFSDSFSAWQAVKRELSERFPTGTKEKTRTLALYGLARNNQRPGRRRPAPRVKPGDDI
jgi:hypothetical protein